MTRLGPLVCAFIFFAANVAAQDSDGEALKIAAMEALIAAPAHRAFPLASKALTGNHSTEVKSRALFVLSQIDTAESQGLILETASQDEGELRLEAIRMIGISGNDAALGRLGELYNGGNENVRDAVLEAYLIAGDEEAVYNIAVSASNEDEFGAAVDVLGAMNAREQLRRLRAKVGVSADLISAYAVSGDAESLRELATDGGEPARQVEAIEALGIIGGEEVDNLLVSIYQGSDNPMIRDAALHGMLISGHDAGVLALYRASQSAVEKRELLQYLVNMGSDDVWNLIDSALSGSE